MEPVNEKPMTLDEVLSIELEGWSVRELLELSFIAGYKEGTGCYAEPTTVLIDGYMDDFGRVMRDAKANR